MAPTLPGDVAMANQGADPSDPASATRQPPDLLRVAASQVNDRGSCPPRIDNREALAVSLALNAHATLDHVSATPLARRSAKPSDERTTLHLLSKALTAGRTTVPKCLIVASQVTVLNLFPRLLLHSKL